MTPAHGTPAMYRRHLRNGTSCRACTEANAKTQPCLKCLAAHAQAERRRREAQRRRKARAAS